MKNYIIKTLFTCVFLPLLFACNDDDNNSVPKRIEKCTKAPEIYNSDNGIQLKLNKQEWSLENHCVIPEGVCLLLDLEGSIQGDSIKVRTYGDGLINDLKLHLDSKKHFNQKLGIYFIPTSKNLEPKTQTFQTEVFIYKENKSYKVNLVSCELPII